MIKNFNDINEIRKSGFTGFMTKRELFINSECIPKQMGIYMIISNDLNPKFISCGTGGFFKGRDPNVSFKYLTDNWVNGVSVIYIGKAGSSTGKATLYSRLNQHFKFGQGKNVGHWGGG